MELGAPEVGNRKELPRANQVTRVSRNKVAVPEGAAGLTPF